MLRALLRLFKPKPARRSSMRPAAQAPIRPVIKARAEPAPPPAPTPPPSPATAPAAEPVIETLKGKCHVIDGDTIVIKGTHIRLSGIDAPELDQPWGKKAKFAMIALCKGHVITAEIQEGTSYDRLVARCLLPDGRDLSALLVEQGLALDWAKFSGGAYRHLEPEGVRKKLWRVAAKHRGKLKMPAS